MSITILFVSLISSLFIIFPVGLKWQIDKKVLTISAIIIGCISWIALEFINLFTDLSVYQLGCILIIIIVSIWTSLLLWRFYRDPEREITPGGNVILAPADGEVIYIKSITNGKMPISEKNGRKIHLNEFVQSDLFKQDGYIVGIAMNFLDVHVNRSPMSGQILKIQHINGLFVSLKKMEAIVQNERVFTIIDNGNFSVGIVQIASRLVRNIVAYLEEGQNVSSGQRIGAIRFGSQVDLIFPVVKELKIDVKKGDKVKAGISIIASFDG